MRWRLFAVGMCGVVLGLVVLQSALTAFARVERADRVASLLARAQRVHQDVDQTHDALRADVLEALRVGVSASAAERTAAGDRLGRDARSFRSNLNLVGSLPLPARLATDLRVLRPTQLRYVAAAEQIGTEALHGRAPRGQGLPAFDNAFGQLERAQADVTHEISNDAARAQADADRTLRAAEGRVVAVSIIALAGLVGLSAALGRMGGQLAASLARERNAAETLQSALLPDRLPEVAGLTFAARFLPTAAGAEVGGDWYDVLPLPGGRIGLAIGDVIGHDLRAAAAMGQVRNALRAWATDGLEPADVLDRLQRLLLTFDPDRLTSCIYATLDPASGFLRWANAGHCPPIVLNRRGATAAVAEEYLPPLGAAPGLLYRTFEIDLEPPATLILYTDGLIERRHEALPDGIEALRQLVQRVGRPTLEHPELLDDLCAQLLATLFPGTPAGDDVALLAVTVAGRPTTLLIPQPSGAIDVAGRPAPEAAEPVTAEHRTDRGPDDEPQSTAGF